MTNGTKFVSFLIVGILGCLTASLQAQIPHWTFALPEELESIRYPLSNGDVLVLHGNHAWCVNGTSGAERWQTELADREEDGVDIVVVADVFLVSSKKNTLQAYNTSKGTLAWELTLDGIEQSDYSSKTDPDQDHIFLRYQNTMVRIAAMQGKELYRSEVDLSLKEHGAAMVQVCPDVQRVAVFTANHTIDIYDDASGKRVGSIPYKPNTDLIEGRRLWRHLSSSERFLTVVDESAALTIDVQDGKEVARTAFEADNDVQTITEDSAGCVLMGSDKVVFVSDVNGKHYEQPYSFALMKRSSTVKVGDKWTLWLSSTDGISVVDQASATLLWKSKPNDPQFAGGLHGMDVGNDKVSSKQNSLLFTMVDQVEEGDHQGTYLYAMDVNPLTGAVKYRTLISVGKNKEPWYQYFRQGTNINFMVTSPEPMWSPETWSTPGEGLVAINENTGAVTARHHVAICEGQDDEAGERPMTREGNLLYVAGNHRILCFDLATGNSLWQSGNDFQGETFALTVNNGVMYAKIGRQDFEAAYTLGDQSTMAFYTNSARTDKLDISADWSAAPYGIVAIDANNGKPLWNYALEADPAIAQGNFTINGGKLRYRFDFDQALDAKAGAIYLCDLENIRAITMGRTGGSEAWSISLSKSGLGEIEIEDAFGYDVDDERLSQPVRMLYADGSIVMFGQKAIGKIAAQGGKVSWIHHWNYSRGDVQFAPYYTKAGMVYGLEGHVKYLDLTTGNVRWDIETNSDTEFHSDRSGKYLISWDSDNLHGWLLR